MVSRQKGRQRRQEEDVVTALPRPAFFPRHTNLLLPLECPYLLLRCYHPGLVLAASLTQFTFYSPTSPYSSSSMALSSLSLPSISISLAPADDTPVEPFSPFDTQPPSPAIQDDSYRPSLLSPPPVVSPRFLRQPSPLRPADTLPAAKGLDRGQFEALLASTRERNAGVRKEPDLRKELAMKSHKSKQRMLLLNSFFPRISYQFLSSGTSRFIPVQDPSSSFPHGYSPPKNSPRVSGYLSLFPPLPGPRFPTGFVRVFAAERQFWTSPASCCPAVGRTCTISSTEERRRASPFPGTDFGSPELPWQSNHREGQGRVSPPSHSSAHVSPFRSPHEGCWECFSAFRKNGWPAHRRV